MQKIKITQKEIDDLYEIEGITEETEATPDKNRPVSQDIPSKQDTTPTIDFDEEELEEDEVLEKLLNWEIEE